MTSRSLLAILGVLVLSSCGPEPGETVVIYVSHDLIYSGPVLKRFENRTGCSVKIVGDTEANKTTGLFNRLLTLKDRPEADVYWNNEVMRMVQLADLGLLQPFVPKSAVGIPPAHCDAAGRWVGFAARARVILYNRNLLKPEEAPRSLLDIVEPRFRDRVALANPLFGTTATHVAALFAKLGSEKARELLLGWKENGIRIVSGNAMARNLVMDGELPICLTDTDDANAALVKGKPVALIYPDQEGMGTLVIPNTVGLVRGGPNPGAGKKLVEYLVSAEVEEMLARSKSAQMPLRSNLTPHGELFNLNRIKAMEVDWNQVAAKAGESAKFVESIFLR